MGIPNAVFFTWVEDELSNGNSVTITVKGFSMLPILRSNRDCVRIVKCSANALKPGDITLFKSRGIQILHRFIKTDGDAYIMRGDNVFSHHETCYADDILGKVVLIKRGSKEISPNAHIWRLIIFLWRIKVLAYQAVSKILNK